MAGKRVDPFPTIPDLDKPKLGIGDRVANFVKDKLKSAEAPKMNAAQSQRAADLSVVPPGQRAEMNSVLNDIDKTDMRIK
jgi:hypothetical protein